MCNLQTVQEDDNTLSLSMRAFLANSVPMVDSKTIKYLVGYCDVTWRVFTPKMSTKFIQHDHTENTVWGDYFLLSGDGRNNRGIFITDRYSLNGEASICLSIAVAKPDAVSILEVYQGESADDQFGFKLWNMKRQTISRGDWEVFQIEGKPRIGTSIDLFFFIVSANILFYYILIFCLLSRSEQLKTLTRTLPLMMCK